MSRAWTRIGRLWTNGESFLALDANILPHWRGLSDNTYQDVIVGLSWDVTSVPVGEGSAAFIATDPEVGGEGWLEVFEYSEAIARHLMSCTATVPKWAALGQPGEGRGPRPRAANGAAAVLGRSQDGHVGRYTPLGTARSTSSGRWSEAPRASSTRA